MTTTKQRTTNQTFSHRDLEGHRPARDMSMNDWEDFFAYMRLEIKPSGRKLMRIPKLEREGGTKTYYGKTNYQEYCSFINDILKTVRRGESDYCFYVYQLKDLLTYEPRLSIEYLESSDCFRVFIDSQDEERATG